MTGLAFRDATAGGAVVRARASQWVKSRSTLIPYYMQDETFVWDDGKAAGNWRDHGVSFEMARDAFSGPFAAEWVDAEQHAHGSAAP
jgi:hypothetical protein